MAILLVGDAAWYDCARVGLFSALIGPPVHLEGKMMADQHAAGPIVSGFSARLVAADGTSYELSGEQTLGRSEDANITIIHPKISRIHARFCIVGQQLTVEDLASANGTRVNQRRVEGIVVLRDGDVVSFDSVNLGVVLTGAVDDSDATVVSFGDDATMVGSWSDSAADVIPDPVPQAPQVTAPASPAPAPAAPLLTRAPLAEAHSTEIPGAFLDQNDGEYTQVLSGVESAASVSSGLNLESASALPHLIIIMKSGSRQVVELEPAGGEQEDVWHIGRDKSCEIAIPEESVSARHAQLIHQNGRWRLVNLLAANGIFVNGKKRLQAYLSDGDEIKMGMAALIFKAGSAAINTPHTASSRSVGTSRKLFLAIALAFGAIAAAVGLWWLLR
jgi:pSer/pThr/pTyr-binding forkhead associated (FHA) protein